MVSAFINGNSLFVTVLGTFDYIKNFLAIFIYATFFNDPKDFKNIFRILLFIALLLGTVALIQFIWAMGSVYILKKEISDKSIYILFAPDILSDVTWRFGIFKTPSLTYDSYILGLFNLLLLTIYLFTRKRGKSGIVALLISGVIASVSRMAYGGLLLVMILKFITIKRLLVLLLLIMIIFPIVRTNIKYDLSLPSIINTYLIGSDVINFHGNIRPYTRHKSLEVWKDHPVWGVGPGMFGGIVASKFPSYIYQEYSVLKQAYIHKLGGIEQFWFQILAEMGIVGALIFGNLLITLFVILNQLEQQAVSEETKGLFLALKIFLGCILIISLGSGINIAPVLFTYCAFVGIGLGISNNSFDQK